MSGLHTCALNLDQLGRREDRGGWSRGRGNFELERNSPICAYVLKSLFVYRVKSMVGGANDETSAKRRG